jgi:HSP20 family molecular chaperone IbpA
MVSDTGDMDKNHIEMPIKKFNSPNFQCFLLLNKSQTPEDINITINIPGGKKNDVNIFLSKNIY